MFRPSYKRGDYGIVKRREAEARTEAVATACRNDFVLKTRAEWEITTDMRKKGKEVAKAYESLANEHAGRLDARRRRLAELLTREREEHESELAGLTSHLLDRKGQMIARATELRKEREEARQRVVKEKLQQAFEAQCPQLHEVQSAMRERDCAAEQLRQVEHREQVKEIERERDREFAAVWEEDRLRKEARHEADVARGKQLELEDARVRDLQVQELRRQRELAKQVREREHQIMIEQWENDQAEAERKKKELAEYKRRAAREFTAFNMARIEEKKKQIAREREEDMKLVEAVLEEGKRLDAQEARKRAVHIASVRHYREQLAKQMEKEKVSEAHLDRMRIAEQEKAWEKRQAEWDAEEESRNRLREEVYRARAEQIQERLEAAKREKEEGKKRRMALIEEQVRLRELDRAEEEERLKQKMYIKEYLEWQMEEKEIERRMEAEDEEMEREAARKAEKAFATRINDTVKGVNSYPTAYPIKRMPFY